MRFDLKNRYDEDKLCANPDKGWYIHYFDNGIVKYADAIGDDELSDFPLLDHVYLRLAWSYLEPEEGKFNWKIIDDKIDFWTARGKKIAFRISCKESGPKDDMNQVYATPKWLFDQGVVGEMVNGCMEPDYGDPLFLTKLNNFHRAFAERYDSREDVIYIDIGSYGDWGEGHCCCSSHRDWSVDVIKKHIRIHLNNYKHTQLVISDDVVGSRNDTDRNQELLDYIIDNNITIRDDGICVGWFAKRFGYNTLRSEEIFDRAWRTMPTVLELEHYHLSLREGTYQDGWPFLASVEGSHATYAGFHGDARKWLNENKELSVMMANRLGYWYFLYRAEISDVSNRGFNIKCWWENKGAAPAYNKYNLEFRIKGENGTYYCKADTFDNTEMMPHTFTVRSYQLNFDAPAGDYTLSLRMFDKNNTTIELGMQDEYVDKDGFYNIADIKL